MFYRTVHIAPSPLPYKAQSHPPIPGRKGQARLASPRGKRPSPFPGQLGILVNAGPALRQAPRVHPPDSLSSPEPVQIPWPRGPLFGPAHSIILG